MLDLLRKNKDSWAVKFLLGAMALMFVFFFGSETMRDPGDSPRFAGSPATVNGVELSGQKANFIVESQLNELGKQFNGEVPANFAQMMRQNIVTSLVNAELAAQDVKRMGLGTSSEELKDHIKKDPQFQENGAFSRDFYLEKFRPWYQLTRGVSYENEARDQLAVAKVTGIFDTVLEPSPAYLEKTHKIKNTTYKFSVIKIRTKSNAGDVLPKKLEEDKSAEETGKAEQKALADKIYAAWKSDAKMDELLKEHKLKIQDTGEVDASRIETVLDGKDDLPALQRLLALEPGAPFPESYFDEGTYYYLIKLAELKPAEAKPTADELEALKDEYRQTLAQDLEASWIQDLTGKGKITYAQ